MTEIIDINTTRLLPQGVTLRGPYDEEQFKQVTINGRAFRLTRLNPHRYVEYYIEPDPPATVVGKG